METAEHLADQLLAEGLLLTALELYAEMADRGRVVTSLKKFFENADNFERFTRKLSEAEEDRASASGNKNNAPLAAGHRTRAESQATLDSLSTFNLTRDSEDSHAHADDRVAVLEFELRRARDTINALRKEVTSRSGSKTGAGHQQSDARRTSTDTRNTLVEDEGAGNDNNNSDEEEDDDEETEPGSREQHALNYLVNEYLLCSGFKLTAITFSDENSEEDFDDWDAIGLNEVKPPNLWRLYRDHLTGRRRQRPRRPQTGEAQVQTDIDEPVQDSSRMEELERELAEAVIARTALSESIAGKDTELEALLTKVASLQETVDRLQNVNNQQPVENASAPVSRRTLASAKQYRGYGHVALKSVPASFVRYIADSCVALSDDQDDDLMRYETADNPEEVLLRALDLGLQRVVPNVILTGREELIPLLLVSIRLHRDAASRDRLLHVLFNLIKRPDVDQRAAIVRGFRAMAADDVAGHDGNDGDDRSNRIETELLPQCWEQIAHKYEERRMLVAETCGALVPFVPSALRGSLILSMLQQLALEDKAKSVRCSAIKSISVLIMYLEDDQKFESLWQLTSVLLKDRRADHRDVSETARNLLLPAVAAFSVQLGTLESVVATDVLADLIKNCEASVDSDQADVDWDAIEDGLSALALLQTFVIYSVITSAPQLSQVIPGPSSGEKEDTIRKLSLDMLLEGKSTEIITALQELLSREWYDIWPQLRWLCNFYLGQIVSVASLVVVGHEDHCARIVHSLIDLVGSLVECFGAAFSDKFVSPLFSAAVENERAGRESALMPVLAAAVLRRTRSEAQLAAEFRSWCLQRLLAIGGYAGNRSLVLVLGHLAAVGGETRAHLADTAWEFVVHPSVGLRCFAAEILDAVVSNMASEDADLLWQKALPGLVTLASDAAEEVRAAAVPALFAVLTSEAVNDAAREKALMQLTAPLDGAFDGEWEQHLVMLKVIGAMKEKWPEMDERTREEKLLPKVVQCYSQHYGQGDGFAISDESRRCEAATLLLSFFTSVSSSLLETSASTSAASVVPCLRRLSLELRQLTPGLEVSSDTLANGLEDRLGHKMQEDDSKGAVMASSTSLDDVKSKVGKLLTFHSGKTTNTTGHSSHFWRK